MRRRKTGTLFRNPSLRRTTTQPARMRRTRKKHGELLRALARWIKFNIAIVPICPAGGETSCRAFFY